MERILWANPCPNFGLGNLVLNLSPGNVQKRLEVPVLQGSWAGWPDSGYLEPGWEAWLCSALGTAWQLPRTPQALQPCGPEAGAPSLLWETVVECSKHQPQQTPHSTHRDAAWGQPSAIVSILSDWEIACVTSNPGSPQRRPSGYWMHLDGAHSQSVLGSVTWWFGGPCCPSELQLFSSGRHLSETYHATQFVFLNLASNSTHSYFTNKEIVAQRDSMTRPRAHD